MKAAILVVLLWKTVHLNAFDNELLTNAALSLSSSGAWDSIQYVTDISDKLLFDFETYMAIGTNNVLPTSDCKKPRNLKAFHLTICSPGKCNDCTASFNRDHWIMIDNGNASLELRDCRNVLIYSYKTLSESKISIIDVTKACSNEAVDLNDISPSKIANSIEDTKLRNAHPGHLTSAI